MFKRRRLCQGYHVTNVGFGTNNVHLQIMLRAKMFQSLLQQGKDCRDAFHTWKWIVFYQTAPAAANGLSYSSPGYGS